MGLSKTAGWIAVALAAAFALPSIAAAQSIDMSPTLLIETGPSDNPDYRRMIFVKYLSHNGVTVNYKAYNRSEFIQIEDDTPTSLIASCLNGKATTLNEIRAFNRVEAQARAANSAPSIMHFCIKGVPNWDAANRAVFLDPIFEGMPHAATLNNQTG
jgi:hypothetical protein